MPVGPGGDDGRAAAAETLICLRNYVDPLPDKKNASVTSLFPSIWSEACRVAVSLSFLVDLGGHVVLQRFGGHLRRKSA